MSPTAPATMLITVFAGVLKRFFFAHSPGGSLLCGAWSASAVAAIKATSSALNPVPPIAYLPAIWSRRLMRLPIAERTSDNVR